MFFNFCKKSPSSSCDTPAASAAEAAQEDAAAVAGSLPRWQWWLFGVSSAILWIAFTALVLCTRDCFLIEQQIRPETIVSSLGFVMELVFFSALVYMMARTPCLRRLTWIPILIFGVALCPQICSLSYATTYLSHIMLVNVRHFSMLPLYLVILAPLMLIPVSLPLVALIPQARNFSLHKTARRICLALVIIPILITIPMAQVEEDGAQLFPVYSAYNLMAERYVSPLVQRYKMYRLVRDHKLSFPPEMFIRQTTFQKHLPGIEKPTDYNVILFSFEGISARLLNCYGGVAPDLTPNFDAFASESTMVRNYFNHTATTINALVGQDGSYTPTKLEYCGQTQPNGLVKMLGKRGWNSAFFTIKTGGMVLRPIMLHCGYNKYFEYPSTDKKYYDQDLFDSVMAYLKNPENTRQKFFLNIYNIHTHAYMNDPAENHFQDGENQLLNAMHNLDFHFGRFMKWLDNSEFANNTMVIITTDHAQFYNNPPYREIISKLPNKPQSIVDRVPLIIRYPGKRKFDKLLHGGVRTTISLAPTILHLLGIKDQPNAFLGNSLFEPPTLLDKYSMEGGISGQWYTVGKKYVSPCVTNLLLCAKLNAYCELLQEGKLDTLSDPKSR